MTEPQTPTQLPQLRLDFYETAVLLSRWQADGRMTTYPVAVQDVVTACTHVEMSSGLLPPNTLFWKQRGDRPVHERRAETRLAELEAAGVLGGSGEEATLFVQSAIYQLRAGALVGCAWDGVTSRIDTGVEGQALAVAQDAMFALASWDKLGSAP